MQHLDLMGAFPYDRHPVMRPVQRVTLAGLKGVSVHAVRELPVGTGKTDVGYAFLNALHISGARQLFYLAPNKALVEQVKGMHPDITVVYGRNEHQCLYYEGEDLKADEIPCSMLRDCPHRVDQETGETHTVGAARCPYLQQKYEARHADGIVACTSAFFLYTVLFSKEFVPEGVVIDEAHRFAQSIRSVLSTELTDWKLERAVETLNAVGSHEVHALSAFLQSMKRLVKHRAVGKETLLEETEIERLYGLLGKVNPDKLEADTRHALTRGDLDPEEDRQILKQVEDIIRSVRRFRHALSFALATKDRWPLNFVFAYGRTEKGDREKWQYKIVVRDYYVVPLIKKMLPPSTLAYSATISDPDVFEAETGIKGDFASLPSDFPVENARIYMPTDTANLAVKSRSKQDKTKSLRLIARSAKRFALKGMRSLVIVVSNEEREKFLVLAAEEGLNALSYGNGLPPRLCAQRFRDGEGECLVGTGATFGEGIDLPQQTAPVIFCLRPGYPHPDDPQTVFEERRFGRRRWALWNWRVIVDLLQVRGRNIRSDTDLGVTFLISQQYRRFAYGALPEWLRPAYRGGLSFEQCVEDAVRLLRR